MSTLPPPSASPLSSPASPASSPDEPLREPVDVSEAVPGDLDRIARDLADVEVALDRLDDGTYWTCEATGRPLPDDLLAADPVARRLLAPDSPQ